VEAVVSWVSAQSNWHETLLIVTGDHETGCLWGPGSNPSWQPLVNHGIGTAPGMQFNSTNHTNSLIALYAQGDGVSIFSSKIIGDDPQWGAYLEYPSIAQVIFTLVNQPMFILPIITR